MDGGLYGVRRTLEIHMWLEGAMHEEQVPVTVQSNLEDTRYPVNLDGVTEY